MTTFIEILFLLMLGHLVADFALQTDAMAKGKNRNRRPDPSVIPPGQNYMPTWGYWLTAHAGTHAAAVYLVTGSPILAALELCWHWLIDFGKCDNFYGVNTDQFLHFACKITIAMLFTLSVFPGGAPCSTF